MFRGWVRGVAVLVALVVVVTAPVSGAWGGEPHFVESSTGASLAGTALVVSFEEAGLAPGTVQTIEVTATATATFVCVSDAGTAPSNETGRQGCAGSTFSADEDCDPVAALTLVFSTAAPLPGSSCPVGQIATTVSVTYTNVLVTDLTSGATFAIPGTFTYTYSSAP